MVAVVIFTSSIHVSPILCPADVYRAVPSFASIHLANILVVVRDVWRRGNLDSCDSCWCDFSKRGCSAHDTGTAPFIHAMALRN